MKKQINKKIISLTQILILLIGILAFSYIVGEIGKQKGIEVSRGIGIVGATGPPECGEDADCGTGGKICNLLTKECEPSVEVEYLDKSGKEQKKNIPENEGENQKKASDYLNSISQGVGYITTAGQVYKIGAKWLAGGKEVSAEAAKKAAEEVVKKAANAGSSIISFTGQGSTLFANVFGSFVAAAGTALLIYSIFKFAGAGQQNLNMIANAGIVGAGVGVIASFAVATTSFGATATGGALALGLVSNPIGWVAAVVTAVFMGFWILFSYQDFVLEIITYEVSSWQAQEGGAKCEECNKIEYGCTEYQCKTFGQGCDIANKGTKQEKCVWLNPDDREYPVIVENISISQLPENYNYKKSTEISPPDTGVEITSTSKNCIPPFSSLTLGVTTDEPAQCRISSEREKNYDEMVKDMDEGTVKIEKHTKILPNSATANDWALNNLVNNSALPNDVEFEITKGNEYEYYIKCKDTNRNENPANFVIKFCVQDKDLTAPIIKGFFVASGSFVQFNTPDLVTEVYTNEPAECKWDFSDKTYNDMQYGMTNCDTTISQATIRGNSCTGNFTGLKNGEENKYYIRCQDRSEDKNTNTASEIYTLKVSGKSILIDSIKVNGKGNNSIIKDARDIIPVDLEIKTSFGAQNGKAKCSYEYLNNQISMSFDYKEINTQTLWLPEGEYTLPISCNDIAGDIATSSISFTLEKDTEAPIVARAYYDVNNLKVITNEPAKCVYTTQSNIGCAYNIEDGTAMNEIGELTHYTSWQPGKKYYIKCKDAFGNQPLLPNQCSIIVKAFESYK